MGTFFPDPAALRSSLPRFSLGRVGGGSLAACLWLWTAVGALTATTTADQPMDTPYQRALDRFNHGDDAHALSQLEQTPAGEIKSRRERADILNLKGAIYLREHRYDEAYAAFDEAAAADHGLWAARFNEAEVSFRAKRYNESHQEFKTLLGHTDRLFHASERHLLEYKLMLADLLAGNEQPAVAFIAEYKDAQPPPISWYYLNAALDFQHGRAAQGAGWLQQAGSHYGPASEQLFADSFAGLGWSARGVSADRAATRDHSRGTSVALAETFSAEGRKTRSPGAKVPPTTVAVVELIPGKSKPLPNRAAFREDPNASGPRPAFRFDAGLAAGILPAAQMPPADAGLNPPPVDETSSPVRAVSPVADVLVRHKSRATPAPSASPSDSPAGSPADSAGAAPSASPSASPSPAASASPTPSPSAAPSGTPSPAFIQKYEAAMVQFLQKNYPEAKKLVDEAEAIQPGQPNAVNLRNQIFKAYYEGAYADYQHADYPAALTQLDGADGIGTNPQNQSDSYNLRGLVLSKQRNYADAEAMFHKAVQTDPGLWAAKFNYAEVPFNYRNFTVARARFEDLFSQTDPVKQPVEAELTQFKVFLTLLLEGKEDQARTFMQHFNFSGATPARYFCQASLNFYAGDVDKAQGWIDSARKEYPARKSSSFLEAFYRVGWLTDPNGPAAGTPGAALAAASPSAAPVVPPAASPALALAAVTPPVVNAGKLFPGAGGPVPTGSLAPTPATASSSPAVPTATPAVAQALRPATTPPLVAAATPAVVAATPKPAPAVVAFTPRPVPSVPAVALATPRLASSAPPAATPNTPRPAPAVAAASPKPVPSAPVVATHAAPPSPASQPAVASVPAARPASTGGDVLRVLIAGAVLLYFLYVVGRIILSAMIRKPKRSAAKAGMPSYKGRKASEADHVEVKR